MINPAIKILLGFSPDEDDKKVSAEWDKRTKNVCKPCWELKYCLYGPLVEDFPLLGLTPKEAIEHNNFLLEQLEKNQYSGERKKLFTKKTAEFDPKNYPTKHAKKDIEKSRSVFGHLCPVFFVNEPFTGTEEKRRIGRQIPRHMIIRVVRRDNNTYQECGKILEDNEIEFDHIISLSKGGSTEEHNLRVTCFDCNRGKSNKVNL